MKGSYAAFGVTNYWEYLDAEREVRQGKNLADAAKVSPSLTVPDSIRVLTGRCRRPVFSITSTVRY